MIDEFLPALTGKYTIDEFRVISTGAWQMIEFPAKTNFYDFHLVVQHCNEELGDRKSFGVFKSDKLTFYVFKHTKSQNNLVGFTHDGKLFSIYLLHDLKKTTPENEPQFKRRYSVD